MQWIGRRYADADVLPASAAFERISPGSTPISFVPTGHHDGDPPILKSPLEVQPRSAASGRYL